MVGFFIFFKKICPIFFFGADVRTDFFFIFGPPPWMINGLPLFSQKCKSYGLSFSVLVGDIVKKHFVTTLNVPVNLQLRCIMKCLTNVYCYGIRVGSDEQQCEIIEDRYANPELYIID